MPAGSQNETYQTSNFGTYRWDSLRRLKIRLRSDIMEKTTLAQRILMYVRSDDYLLLLEKRMRMEEEKKLCDEMLNQQILDEESGLYPLLP